MLIVIVNKTRGLFPGPSQSTSRSVLFSKVKSAHFKRHEALMLEEKSDNVTKNATK